MWEQEKCDVQKETFFSLPAGAQEGILVSMENATN